MRSAAATLLLAASCAGSPSPGRESAADQPSFSEAEEVSATPSARAAASQPPPERADSAPGAASREPEQERAARWTGTEFPPPPVEPMHDRTKEPGDGSWKVMAHGLGEEPVMARALLHPHPIKGFVFVDIIAFDRSKVDLHLVAGTQQPETKVAPELRTGLVPETDHERLLVVFNGGFMTRHGHYGMMLDGSVLVPPKEDACAVALYPGDGVKIGSWPTLAGEGEQMVAWRQTPPCLVEGGEVNPRLERERATRRWGAAAGGDREIRRSAIGVDASGRSLLYAFGDWISAQMLAEALAQAGAQVAAELDINWSYTRFYVFEHPAGEAPRIASTIVPKAKYSPDRYVEKPSYRDFFYLTLDEGD